MRSQFFCRPLILVAVIITACRQTPETPVLFDGIEYSSFLEEKAIGLLRTSLDDGEQKIKQVTLLKADHILPHESYQLNLTDKNLIIRASSWQGAIYGTLDVHEHLEMNAILPSSDEIKSPTLAVRAIKFNLPWSAYRESASMSIHEKTCRDPEFWKAFLDMMLSNRFNTLLLYNKHPFPFMVRVEEYPEACPYSEQEMEEWKSFWQELLRMAKERAIDVFIVNWNIIVSPSFAHAYKINEYNDTSQVTIDYTRKSVTALINEYPDLAGIGVTLADWMNGMSPAKKEIWIEKTFVDGMKEANRPVKFLHRAVLSGSSDEMRKLLDRAALTESTDVEIKFNWSHGHSTPKLLITHASETGEVNTGFWDPAPDNYHIQWMIRNEDFFILRWGDASFIRQHISLNSKPFVNGYHIGSEGYIPALNYFDKKSNAPQYAFERQWLFYMLWGRLLYDHGTSDSTFTELINKNLNTDHGHQILKAYEYASKMPLMLASFFKSTWDYTLYSEGFMAPVMRTEYGIDDQQSPFISLEELMDHQTLDTSYISVSEYTQLKINNTEPETGQQTPLMIAEQLMTYADSAEIFINLIEAEKDDNPHLQLELIDVKMWTYLLEYFAHKLSAATSLSYYRVVQDPSFKNDAIKHLNRCLSIWKDLSKLGEENYYEVPYWESRVFNKDSFINDFSWQKYLPEVERDLEVAKGY
ncbi:MAG: hypothetical protein IPL46_03940 [Saprospiraceae bacterium]|nr:hypothetical protein [Saprospiraceae bacterium]